MAVDVGSAVGYLDLDINGFLAGLKTAQNEADSVTKNMVTKIGGGLQTVGDKMSILGVLATASITTPIVTAVTASVKQFAKLEQSVGGVETLFKNSAKTVIDNAEKAYKTAGVDANSYMEQVTSFSATLLQGLGGDTEKAASYADKAVIDMSDNANKMGTNIGMIQDAYQGFAKDNYTMLDNLKLGYGGTAEEMARLVNESGVLNGKFKATAENVKDIPFSTLIDAIHITQDNLGITGTTAKEAAETVSGSFQMATSSVQNFLQQLGNPGADMDRFAKEMIESIGVFVENVKIVLLTIWDNLPISPLKKKLIVAAAAFGPIMFATGKIVSAVDNITLLVDKAIPIVSQFASGFASAGTALGDGASKAEIVGAAIGGISAPVVAIIAVIAVLISAFVTLWQTNEDFRNKLGEIWGQIKASFEGFTTAILVRINEFGFEFESIAEVIGAVWKGFCDLLGPIFIGAFQLVADTLDAIFGIILGLVDVFTGIFTGDWDTFANGIRLIFGSAWEWIVDLFTNVGNTLKGILDVICGWFSTTWEQTWTNIKQFFIDTWNGILTFFSTMGQNISTGFQTFVTNIQTFFANLPQNIGFALGYVIASIALWIVELGAKAIEAGSTFVTNVVTFFQELPGNILNFLTSAAQNIQTWVSEMPSKAREMGSNFINSVVTFFVQLPGNIQNFLNQAINAVMGWIGGMVGAGSSAASGLVNAVISGVSGLPGMMSDIGSNIVQGVWNGIQGAIGWFTGAVNSFFSGIVSGAKAALGIQSPSTVMRDQVGKQIPPGITAGVEYAMPAAIRNIQGVINKGVQSISVDNVMIGVDTQIQAFTTTLKGLFEDVAVWFESISSRIGKSISVMQNDVESLIRSGQTVVNQNGTLGYIRYGGFTQRQSQGYESQDFRGKNDTSADKQVFNFYSPKQIDEIQASRLMRQTQRDLAEKF